MAALTEDRDTQERDGKLYAWPIAAATILYAGSMGALDSNGNAVPASATASLKVVGRVEERADNRNGNAGDVSVQVRRGVFCFANSSGGGEVTRADIGSDCYVADDHTVAKSDSNNRRPKAGTIMDVDAIGVWVRF